MLSVPKHLSLAPPRRWVWTLQPGKIAYFNLGVQNLFVGNMTLVT